MGYAPLTEGRIEIDGEPLHGPLIEAVSDSLDRKALVDWMAVYLPHSLTMRQADHMRRRLAVQITNALSGTSHAPGERLYGGAGDLRRCQEWFDEWLEGEEEAHSPHFEMRIRPFIDHIDTIAEGLVAHEWEPQPGDAEISELADRLNKNVQAAEA